MSDKVTIDDKEYKLEDLSQEAVAQLRSMQFVDTELARIGLKTAALQTARNAYAKALRTELGTEDNGDGDAELDLPDNLSFD